MLAGHGTVRYNILGMSDEEPTETEQEEMADLVAETLEQGAVGFSTGLIYSPQSYAETAEIRRLATELRPYGRPFFAHIRNQGRWI
jgi:N-acyl-D-amino-acid deacylase